MKYKILSLLLLVSFKVFGQTPNVAPITDESDFPGSTVCTSATISNTGLPGYGPYLRVNVPDGLSISSSSLFGDGVSLTNVGVFGPPPPPGNELIDPITGDVITGAEGDTFYVIQPPIGSVVAGGVPIAIDICFAIDPNAPVNNDIPVEITPVYEFGDTPTGDNGPIIGAINTFNITPILVEFEKQDSAPESERPPGPDWPVTYTLITRVAPNNTVDNVVVNDILPVGFVLDVLSISVVGGNNCVVQTNSPLNVTCDSIVGTGANDLTISYSGHFADILDESACVASTQTNNATFDADFSGLAIPQESDSQAISIEHLTIQKDASDDLVSPGQIVTFTLNIQLSEFAIANGLVVTDVLPDGYTFQGGSETSSLGPITAIVSNDTPGNGQTTLEFDLTAITGNITGGNPNISVTYSAEIDQSFFNNEPVLASDALTNNVSAAYDLTGGAAACSNSSTATTSIEPVAIMKEVINPQPFYKAGDSVTYRLSLSVPSGDTNGVVFEDFLPLPVFDATTVSTVFGVDVVAAPTDTLGLVPTTINTDGGTNSVTINWPNITTATPQVLAVDLTVTISSDPFADNLNLSNLLQVTSENSGSVTATAVTPVLILVRSPDLVITKGVLSADQGVIAPLPSVLPVDGDIIGVDANDVVTFQITVENQGGAQAFDVVIDDPAVPGLNNCVVSSVTDGNGGALASSGDLLTGISLTNPLAGNDDNPAGGGAPFSDDTALVNVTCEVANDAVFNTTYLNTASVSYSAIAAGPTFPVETDTATITTSSPTIEKTILQVLPNVDGVNNTITIGETIQYQVVITLPEGQGNNAQLVDLLDNGLVFDSFDSLVASSADVTSSVGFPAALAAAGNLNTRNGLISFGTVNNINADNAVEDTITVVYTVLVSDVGNNNAGNNRNNRADFNTDTTTIRDTAPNRQIREPLLQVNKTATPNTADAGDTISYTVTVSNNARPTNRLSPAFDVLLEDLLADADLTLVVGSVVASQGTVITGNTGGDTTIDVDVGTLAINASMTVTFDAIISNAVESGDTVSNTATVTNYNSIPGGGRVYPDVDATANVAIDAAITAKTVLGATSTEQSDGISTRGDGSLVDLTIGEEVTFEITTTLAEGVSPSVIITDNLPNNAAGQMEYVSANIVFPLGTNLTPTNPAPPAVPAGSSSVSFDFGSVTNAADGTVDANDQIVIQVTGRVTDIAANVGIEELINNVQVQFNTGLNATAQATIEVVEPVLTIDKTSATVTADAGDTITFVMTIENLLANGTSANAFDVTLSDNIPSGFTFAGNLSTDSGLAPDVGTLVEAGGVISATWTNYPIGSSTVISFDVTVDNTVTPGQIIQNTAAIAWTSLPGTPVVERTSSDSDPHSITIGETGLVKLVTATSEPSTGITINGGEDDLTIGEQVTYRFTVSFPEGTTPNAVVVDQLPTGSSILSVVNSSIVSIGGQLTPAMGTVGDSGTVTNTDADGYDDRIEWSFGDIFNSPDGASNSNDEIVFEVVALVVDDAINQGGANDVVNTASLTYTGGSRSGTALVDIVEPRLSITKATLPAVVLGDAGDVIDYQLTIAHLGSSNADAFNLVITDLLPDPGASWINDATFSSTCGAVVNSSSDPSIEFTINQLALASGTCTINYQIEVDVAVKPGASYTNNVVLEYDSTPVFVAGATRRSTDASSATFNIGVPSITKTVTSTSLNDTGAGIGDMMTEDLTVGELVDYVITITVPEGTSNNSTLVDNLPVDASGGVMEVTAASVTSIGANITTTLPGTPVFSNTDADGLNDQVLFDFGNIVNTPDMVVDAGDQITVTITGRITDNGLNNAVETYINDALFTFGLGGNTINATADVELVEPNLELTKSMGTPNNLVVPIQLTLTNTAGTASAYDLTLVDVLDGNIWDLATITPTSIPSGFNFVVTPGPGATESTVTINSNGTLPDSSIEPNEVLVFEFSVEIRDDIALPSSIDNTITLTEASSVPGIDSGERDYSDIIATDTLQLSNLDSTKSDALVVDSGVIGEANPDDTIRYTIEIDNSGTADATAVVFSDAPDVNSTLVVGSVTTSQGTVTTGNTAGDSVVVVDIGTMNPSTTITVTFDVTINNPFPVGVTEIVNQGLIESNEAPPFDTDDPDTGPDDDPTITPIGAGHDLTISKDDGGITAQAGDTIIYTLNYANIGDQNTTGVVITETVPNTTVFNTASSTAGWSCANGSPAGTTCTLTIGALDGGDSGSANFAVDVFDPKPAGVTEILNNVSIADDGNNGPEDDPLNNNDNDNTPIDAAPDLTLAKTSNGADVSPGGVIVYTLTYQNIGSQGATGVVITDTVPVNTTFNAASSSVGWSCADGDPAGTVCTFNVAGTVAADDPAVGVQIAISVDNPLPTGVTQVSNVASIADDGNNGADTNPNNNEDDEDTNIIAVPDLVVSKDDGGITASAGSTIPFIISYSNLGNQEATGVIITETVPANTTFNAGASDAWVCVPNINAGSTCTLNIGSLLGGGGNGTATFAVDVDSPKPSGVTQINNTVTIADDGNNGADPDTSNNTGDDSTPVDAVPDLTLMKTSQTNVVSAGGLLIYDLVYENIGTQNATGVVITETIPVNSIFNATNSTPTWSCVDGSIAGTVCTFSVGNVDVGSGAETIQFAITVIDPLPAGADEISNNASIADDGTNGPDPNPDNNNDDDVTNIGAAPDLLITKTDVENLVEPGGVIVYQLSYSNIGNQDSTGVVITETVPAETTFNAISSTTGWSCADNSPAGTTCSLNVGAVNAGDAAVIVEFSVNVPNPIPAGVDTVFNNASIADDGNNGDDADTSNNDDDEETTIGAFPDLRISKTDNDVTSAPGGIVVYILDYGNDGTQDSTGVVITETVPAHTTFDAAGSTAGWVCLPSSAAGSTCEYTVGNLNAGDAGSVDFAVLIDDPLAAGVNEIFNQVSIEDDGTNGDDINPDNDTGEDDTSVLLDPPVGIKTGNIVNGVAEWRIYWFNPNNNRDLPVFIYDPIPENSSYVDGSADCVATGTSTCTVPVFDELLNQIELNAIISPDEGAPVDSTESMLNNEIVITFRTRINGAGPVTVANQAEANWDEDNDGDPNNDADDGQDPVVTDAPDTVEYGDPTVLRTFFPVPTLSLWSLLIMMMCFMGLMWVRRHLLHL